MNNSSPANTYILIVSIVIVVLAVINRTFRWPGEYIHGSGLRLTKLYLETSWLALSFVLVGAACWFFVPDTIPAFQGVLLATFLGVGASILLAEGLKTLTEHKRVKKTFATTLRYVAIPYLKSQAESMKDTISQQAYQGKLSKAQALLYLTLASNFDTICADFDKTWLQPIHSQDFIDAMRDEDLLYKIADVELEALSFTKLLATQSVRAKYWLINWQQIPANQQAQFISDVESMRDDMKKSADSLAKYSDVLGEAILTFLLDNGARQSSA